jgi:hypothetical protein
MGRAGRRPGYVQKVVTSRETPKHGMPSGKAFLLGREQVNRKFLGEQAFFDNPATPFLDT